MHLVFRVNSKPLKREDFHCEKKVVVLVGASRLKRLWKSQPVVQDCHHCPPLLKISVAILIIKNLLL